MTPLLQAGSSDAVNAKVSDAPPETGSSVVHESPVIDKQPHAINPMSTIDRMPNKSGKPLRLRGGCFPIDEE
ncbi:hypothetical protein FRB99_003532, partial [Tulasnella sp. 403]